MATVIYKKKRKQTTPTNSVEKKTIETKITKQQKNIIESKQADYDSCRLQTTGSFEMQGGELSIQPLHF